MLTPPPGNASADTRIDVIGRGFAVCVAGHGEVESSGNEASVVAAGDASLFLDGMEPVAFLHLDKDAGLSAILEIAESASPGDHQVTPRCVNDTADTGSADMTVTMPPDPVTLHPDTSPVNVPSANPIPPANTVSPEQLSDSITLSDRPDDPDSPDGADGGDGGDDDVPRGQSPLSDARPPSGNTAMVAANEPSPHGAGLRSWTSFAAALLLVGFVLTAPSLSVLAFEARRGPKWVRANVRAVAGAAAPVGTELTPPIDDHWPPTSCVRFALHADSGTQVFTAMDQ